MLKFLSNNPEIIIFLLVGAASILGRLRKAVQSGEGPGGIRIPQPTEIQQHAPIPPRTAIGQPVSPTRVQPVRRPGRPKPGRPQGLRRPTPSRKRAPPAGRPSPPVQQRAIRTHPEPAAEGPKPPAEQHVETRPEGSKPAMTPPGRVPAPLLQGLLTSRDDLRRAVLTAEILGRPLALR